MYTLLDVLKIKEEKDLFDAFGAFETELNETIKPLRDKLKMQIMSQDVPQLELHMTYVESWRDRIAQYLGLASTFVEHSKSSYFLLPDGKAVDREAYMRKMCAGFTGIKTYLEELVRSIDSRVNVCKKVLITESDGFNGRSKV